MLDGMRNACKYPEPEPDLAIDATPEQRRTEMPRRKIPDDIPLPGELNSTREILRRAMSARQEDPNCGYEMASAGATVVTQTSRLAETYGDEEGLLWWS